MPKLTDKWTYQLKAEQCETPKGISLTVPDEAMSMREIITRFARTRQVDVNLQRVPSYDGEAGFDTPDLEKLKNDDIFDRKQFAEELAAHNQEQRDLIRKKIEEKQKQQTKPFSKIEKETPPPRGAEGSASGGEEAPKGKTRPKSEPPEDD